MFLIKVSLSLFVFSSLSLGSPVCSPCPSRCDYGTSIHIDKANGVCVCECSPDPCLKKECPQGRSCRVMPNPNCNIGYCALTHIPTCISMPGPLIYLKEPVVVFDYGYDYSIEPFVEYYGNPSFKWLKDYKEVMPNNCKIFGSIITMYKVNQYNQGIYTLVVSDEFGTSSIDIKIYVSEPTVITHVKQEEIFSLLIKQDSVINLQEGYNYNILCMPEENSDLVYWHKGSVEKLNLMIQPNKYLKIRNAQYSDSGEYTCRSIRGSETLLISIAIKVNQIEPFVARISYKKIMSINENFDFECGLSHFENSPIQWSFNGRDIAELRSVEITDNKLKFYEIGYEHRGKLSCFKPLINDRFIEESVSIDVINPFPEINSIKQIIQVTEGYNAHLKCKIICMTGCKINWYDPSGILIQSNEEELVLNNVNPSLSGKYTCEAKNSVGVSKAFVDLQVTESKNMRVQASPEKLDINEGDNSLLECLVYNSEYYDKKSVKWSRKNYKTLPKSFSTSNNLLLIKNIKREDAGEYECLIKTKNGYESSSFIIQVIYEKQEPFPVYINLRDINENLIENESLLRFGSQLKVECLSENSDTVNIEWVKESGVNRSKSKKWDNYFSVLIIPAFTTLDLGKYNCIVTDSNGKKSQNSIDFFLNGNKGNILSFKINGPSNKIEEKSIKKTTKPTTDPNFDTTTEQIEQTEQNLLENGPIVEITGPKHLKLSKFQSVQIECNVMNGENVTFSRHEGDLPSNSFMYTNNTYYYLVMQNLEAKDSGYYLCYSFNSYGKNRDYIYLEISDIEEKEFKSKKTENEDEIDYDDIIDNGSNRMIEKQIQPTAKILGPKEIDLKEEDTIEIICEAENSDNTELYHQNNKLGQVSNKEKIFKYTLKNVTVEDSGYYICIVNNDKGSNRDYIYIEVNSKDKIENLINSEPLVEIIGDKRVFLNEGESVELKCKVNEGDEVTFDKENDRSKSLTLEKNDNLYTLKLKNLTIEDSGYYECSALNQYGKKNERIYVEVRKSENSTRNKSIDEHSIKKTQHRAPIKFSKGNSSSNEPPLVEIYGSKDLKINKSSSYELVCEVKGGEEVEFKSYYENWPDYFETENIGNIFKLRLLDLKPKDSGFYYCLSTNQHGNSLDYVRLEVHGDEDDDIDH